MQIFPHKPSVLSVKTKQVHSVLQSSAVQVCASFSPFHVFCALLYFIENIGERAASVLPPLCSKRFPFVRFVWDPAQVH